MLDAAWPGAVVHDSVGNIFTLDMDNALALEYAGTSDVVLYDMAFSPAPESKLYGITLPYGGFFSELVSFDIDLSGDTPVITTESIDTIHMGINNGIYANSLGFNAAGELFAAGYDVSGDNELFKIDPDTNGAQRVLDLGVHISSGDLTFDTDGNLYLTTSSGNLLQIPPGQNDINVVGQTLDPDGEELIQDFFGLLTGPEPLMHGFRTDGTVYVIDTDNAETTLVGQMDPDSLEGLNDVFGAATVFPPPTDLGEIDFRELPGQTPTLGELWYRVEAAHDAILTIDLPNVAPGSPVDLSLYEFNGQGELVQLSTQDLGDLRLDYEDAVDGGVYYVQIEGVESPVDVRVTNLVNLVGNGAMVHGTDETDTFEFAPGPPYTVMINGVNYPYNFSSNPEVTVTFNGGIGRDVANLTGSIRDDVATLNLGTASGLVEQLGLLPRYRVIVNNTPLMTFDGVGGQDSADLVGTASADMIVLTPATATLSRSTTAVGVANVETIDINAGSGADTAVFTGTAANETVDLAYLNADFGSSSFDTTVTNAETISATGGGGNDTADLRGGAGQEWFKGYPSTASMYRKSYYTHQVTDFDAVVAHGTPGGNDVAQMWGSAAQVDTFDATPDNGQLSATGVYSLRAEAFRYVHAYGNPGNQDVARLHGDPGSQDTLEAWPDQGKLYGSDYFTRAKSFRYLYADGNAGDGDVAMIHDASGQADTFDYWPDYATLSGSGFFTQANAFRYVHAYATAGDGDLAQLHDDPSQADTFDAWPTCARLYNDDHFGRAKSFRYVYATATPGHDNLARFHDDPDRTDTFEASPDWARHYADDYFNRAESFRWVHSWSTPGFNDVARFYDDPTGNDKIKIWPGRARLYRDGVYFVQAKRYQNVYAEGTSTNADRAVLFDSALTDYLTAAGNTAEMHDGPVASYYHHVTDFWKVVAYSSTPTGDYKTEDAVDYILRLRGDYWQDLPP